MNNTIPTKTCPRCGEVLGANATFCPGCGSTVENTIAPTAIPSMTPPVNPGMAPGMVPGMVPPVFPEKKKLSGKFIALIAGGSALLVVLIIVLIVALLPKKDANTHNDDVIVDDYGYDDDYEYDSVLDIKYSLPSGWSVEEGTYESSEEYTIEFNHTSGALITLDATFDSAAYGQLDTYIEAMADGMTETGDFYVNYADDPFEVAGEEYECLLLTPYDNSDILMIWGFRLDGDTLYDLTVIYDTELYTDTVAEMLASIKPY